MFLALETLIESKSTWRMFTFIQCYWRLSSNITFINLNAGSKSNNQSLSFKMLNSFIAFYFRLKNEIIAKKTGGKRAHRQQRFERRGRRQEQEGRTFEQC
jgi:hypothetical protein